MIASFFSFLSSDPSLLSYIDAGRRKDNETFSTKVTKRGETERNAVSSLPDTQKEKVEMYVDTFIHEKV